MNRREFLKNCSMLGVYVSVPSTSYVGYLRSPILYHDEPIPVLRQDADKLISEGDLSPDGEYGRSIHVPRDFFKLAVKILERDARRFLLPGWKFELRHSTINLPHLTNPNGRSMAWYSYPSKMRELPPIPFAEKLEQKDFVESEGYYIVGRGVV